MSLHVCYQNVRGLRTKLKDFRLGVNCSSCDVVFVTESLLSGKEFDSEVVDPAHYFVFRRDRETTGSAKKDGGVS